MLAEARGLARRNLDIYRQRAELRTAQRKSHVARRSRLAVVRENEIRVGDIGDFYELQAATRRTISNVRGQINTARNEQPRFPRVSGQSAAIHGFERSTPAYRAIEMYGEQLRQTAPRVVDMDGDPVPPATRRAQKILQTLRHPSGRNGPVIGSDLFDSYSVDLLTYGNALHWIGGGGGPNGEPGPPVTLNRMPPGQVQFLPKENLPTPNGVDWYIYTPDTGTEIGKPFWIPYERVIHWKMNSARDHWFGMPPLFSAFKHLAIDSELADVLKLLLDNKGIPSYALIVERENENQHAWPADSPMAGGSGPATLEDIRDRVHELTQGPHRGKPPIMKGMTIKTLSLSMRDMEISTLVPFPEGRIAMAFGVPLSLLGKSGGQNEPSRSTMFQEKVVWLNGPVTSLAIKYDHGINSRLMPFFDNSSRPLRLRTDLSGIAALQDQRIERSEKMSKVFLSRLYTRHVCQRMAGEPTSGPDEFSESRATGRVVPLNDENNQEQSEQART